MASSPPPIQKFWNLIAIPSMDPLYRFPAVQPADPFWIFDSSNRALFDCPIPLLHFTSSILALSSDLSFLTFYFLFLIDYFCPDVYSISPHLKRLHHFWCIGSFLDIPCLPTPVSLPMALSTATSSARGKEVMISSDASPPKFTVRTTSVPPDRVFLLARVLGAKKEVDRYFFHAMKSAWLPVGKFEHSQLDDNLFLFSFSDPSDLQRIIEGSPWDYDSKSKWVVIKPVGGTDQFSTIPLSEICATFRPWLDVGKPLVDKVELPSDAGQNLFLPFTYVNLPTFCYYCGILGHGFRHCALWNQATTSEAVSLPFSDSLRVVDFGSSSSVTRHSPSRAVGGRRSSPRFSDRRPASGYGGQAALIGNERSTIGSGDQLQNDTQRSVSVIKEPLLDNILSQVKDLLLGKVSSAVNPPLNPPINPKMLQLSDFGAPASTPFDTDGLTPTPQPGLGLSHNPQAHVLIPGIGLLGSGPKVPRAGPADLNSFKPIPSTNPTSPNTPIPYSAAAPSPNTHIHPFTLDLATSLKTTAPVHRRPTSVPAARSPATTPLFSPIRSARELGFPGLSWSPNFANEVSDPDRAAAGFASPPSRQSVASHFSVAIAISPLPVSKGGDLPRAVQITEIEEPSKIRNNNESSGVVLERYSRNRVRTKSKAYNSKRQKQIVATAGCTPLHLPPIVSSDVEDSHLEVVSSPRPEAAVASQPRLDQ